MIPTHPMLRLAVVACGLLLAACATTTPQETLVLYAEALEHDDPEQAYALLSPELRAQLSLDEFERNWPRYREQMRPVVDSLRNSEERSARVHASVDFSDYDNLQLRLSDGRWKISSGLFNFYAQDTPRHAVVSFVRAMEERRFDVLMRFIPSEYAQHMTPDSLKADFEQRADEIDAMVDALKANMNNPIQTRKDHAYMPYGEREVTLVLEGDAWKVEDPD